MLTRFNFFFLVTFKDHYNLRVFRDVMSKLTRIIKRYGNNVIEDKYITSKSMMQLITRSRTHLIATRAELVFGRHIARPMMQQVVLEHVTIGLGK